MSDFSGRIAVISGASSGIGAAAARELVSRGCRVVVSARREERLRALADELNKDWPQHRVVPVVGDACEQPVVEEMLDAAAAAFGRDADLVLVNAGRGLRGSVLDSDPAQWETILRLNVLGAARLLRAASLRMIGLAPDDRWTEMRRDIIVLGSSVGKNISPFSSMYGSTKFAIGSLAEAARRELAPRGVRVTLVAPAVVKSEFQDAANYDPVGFGEFMERIGPVLSPEDVSRLICFIASQPPAVHINDVMIRPTRQEYP